MDSVILLSKDKEYVQGGPRRRNEERALQSERGGLPSGVLSVPISPARYTEGSMFVSAEYPGKF